MIKRLAHVCILARDLEETQRFYCDVLGLTRQFVFEKDGQMIGYYLAVGDSTFIEVFKGEPGNGQSAMVHFCLETKSVDALKQHLEHHGIAAGEKKRGSDHSWQIRCTDPNGIVIEFHEYTGQSLQFAGGTAHVNW